MKVPTDPRTPSNISAWTIALLIVLGILLAWVAYRYFVQPAPLPNFHW